MENIVDAVRIVRLDNGRYHFFNADWNGEDDIPYLHIVPEVSVCGLMVSVGPHPIITKDVNGYDTVFEHTNGYVTKITVAGLQPTAIELSKDSPMFALLVAKLDVSEDQTLIPEEPPKPVIDPEPSAEYMFKIYKDLDGEWCMNHSRVILNLASVDDWYIEGLFGEMRTVYLIDRPGDKVYKLTNLCAGRWSEVEVGEYTTVTQIDPEALSPRAPLRVDTWTKVDAFELHVEHDSWGRFEYIDNAPARL